MIKHLYNVKMFFYCKNTENVYSKYIFKRNICRMCKVFYNYSTVNVWQLLLPDFFLPFFYDLILLSFFFTLCARVKDIFPFYVNLMYNKVFILYSIPEVFNRGSVTLRGSAEVLQGVVKFLVD